MKPFEVFQALESMIAGLDPNPQETQMIDQLLDTIKRWELILEFYAKSNYDRGLIARDALETLTDEDRKKWNVVKSNATRRLVGDKTDS